MERTGTIARAFGKAVGTYRLNGALQQQVAKELCRKFAPFPQGAWLEVGCGTGFLTEELLTHHPEKLFVNDLIEAALPQDARLQFLLGDGEILPFPQVSMVASSFALQWFSDPVSTIQKWAEQCQKVIVALPIAPSFSEWEALPLNPLPTKEDLLSLGGNLIIEKIPLAFASPWGFLEWLKNLGAHASLRNERASLSFLRYLAKQKNPFKTEVTVAYLEVSHV